MESDMDVIDYKKVLELLAANVSKRELERRKIACRESCTRIQEAAIRQGISWPLENPNITNEELHNLLFPDSQKKRQLYVQPDYSIVHKRLSKKGVTLQHEWEKYYRDNHDSKLKRYGYSRFRIGYNKWAETKHAIMRIARKPGETMMVDWAGLTLSYTTRSGNKRKVYFFVSVLPYSNLIYTCACSDMKSASWLNSHIRAFEYYGGVPELLIPDNLKTGVKKHEKYDVELNAGYQELAKYYNTAVIPTRVKRPTDKGPVERSVRIISEQIIVKLQEMKLHSLDEINESVAQLLEIVNGKKLTTMELSRFALYMEEEHQYMRTLPQVPFEVGIWSSATVSKDYLVVADKNKYSVPYTMIGKKVILRVTEQYVYVYHDGSLVTIHERTQSGSKNPIIKTEHMPPNHLAIHNYYNLEYIRTQAEKIGGIVQQMITDTLDSEENPKQGIPRCLALIHLVEKCSKEAVESAYRLAVLNNEIPTIPVLEKYVNKLDGQSNSNPQHDTTKEPIGFSRGCDYYT